MLFVYSALVQLCKYRLNPRLQMAPYISCRLAFLSFLLIINFTNGPGRPERWARRNTQIIQRIAAAAMGGFRGAESGECGDPPSRPPFPLLLLQLPRFCCCSTWRHIAHESATNPLRLNQKSRACASYESKRQNMPNTTQPLSYKTCTPKP